jgi:predicted AlkP superfamily pyrophosphatase or phosphodiesterase
LILAGLLCPQTASAETCKHFIEISVDGLGSVYLQPMVEKNEVPNFRRFQTEGVWTNNARNDDDVTVTLPNHTTMMTGRSVKGPGGHHYTKNTDPPRGETLHNQKQHDGTYIASVFDVAHDHGLRTALMAGKTKFSLYRDSYDAAHGAVNTVNARAVATCGCFPRFGWRRCLYGDVCVTRNFRDLPGGLATVEVVSARHLAPDCGRNKIDRFVCDPDCRSMTTAFVTAMQEKPLDYVFLHYADPDAAGHALGWGGDAYQKAIRKVDAQLGRIFQLIEKSDELRGKTTIFLTADHGGKDHNHADNLLPEVYTIPVYIWGCGAAAGKDLYKLNAATRRDPLTGHPRHTDPVQPVRNGDGANLALKLLGLGPVPGSTINFRQDLAIGP